MRGRQSAAFSARSVRWITGLVLASFFAAIVLTLLAEDLGEPVSPGADSFSYSALGHRAFAELMERSGVAVSRRRSERGFAAGPRAAFLAAEPRPAPDDPEGILDRIERLAARGAEAGAALIVVLPKRIGTTHPLNPAWIADHAPLGRDAVQRILDDLPAGPEGPPRLAEPAPGGDLACSPDWADPVTVRLSDPQLLEPAEGLEPVVTCGGKLLVAGIGGPAPVYLVADPDLINNQGLSRASNAEVAGGFLLDRLAVTELIIDETIHGFLRGTGLFQELAGFPLVLAVAHGLIVLALLVWSAQGRFGRPEPPPSPLGSGKEVLIRNAALMMRVAGATARSVPQYLEATIRSVADHYFVAPGTDRARTMERLAGIGRARRVATDLERLRREAERSAAGAGEAAAVALALRIHRWKEEMTHVGR